MTVSAVRFASPSGEIRIGRLDGETMLRLNRAMLVFLGLAG